MVTANSKREYKKIMARFRELNNVDPQTEAEYETLKASQAAERESLHARIAAISGPRRIVRWAVA